MTPILTKLAMIGAAAALAVLSVYVHDETAQHFLFGLAGTVAGWAVLKRPGDTAP